MAASLPLPLPLLALLLLLLSLLLSPAIARPPTPHGARHGHGGEEEDEGEGCAADLIRALPGAPPHAFKQYSGYVTVDMERGRHLFYWFAEAEEDAAQKPLTLWLNGGPGCSSVAGGALSELGPFFPDKAGAGLIKNEYTWIKESNIIFLESPAGVGFSYSENTSDYVTGDERTASDTREFLLGWFKKFPQYKDRPFYISGESYAGHYVPDLAHLLLKKSAEDKGIINLKGFLLGNPWTVTDADFKGLVYFWYSRTLISTHTYNEFLAHCNVEDYWNGVDGDLCYDLTEKVFSEIGDINYYDIYVDVCTSGPLGQAAKLLAQRGLNMRRKNVTLRGGAPYDPCIDDEVEVYLNRPAVQAALHAAHLPYRWQGCSDIVDYSSADAIGSKWAVWLDLLASDLRLTVFSGDVDSVCPTVGTRNWILQLEAAGHLHVSKKWHPWYHLQQVGGYAEEFNGGRFKFVTVRDAGHMVPYTQPGRALVLFREFLNGRSMPLKQAEDAGVSSM